LDRICYPNSFSNVNGTYPDYTWLRKAAADANPANMNSFGNSAWVYRCDWAFLQRAIELTLVQFKQPGVFHGDCIASLARRVSMLPGRMLPSARFAFERRMRHWWETFEWKPSLLQETMAATLLLPVIPSVKPKLKLRRPTDNSNHTAEPNGKQPRLGSNL
jgi:hypothetical protein